MVPCDKEQQILDEIINIQYQPALVIYLHTWKAYKFACFKSIACFFQVTDLWYAFERKLNENAAVC